MTRGPHLAGVVLRVANFLNSFPLVWRSEAAISIGLNLPVWKVRAGLSALDHDGRLERDRTMFRIKHRSMQRRDKPA